MYALFAINCVNIIKLCICFDCLVISCWNELYGHEIVDDCLIGSNHLIYFTFFYYLDNFHLWLCKIIYIKRNVKQTTHQIHAKQTENQTQFLTNFGDTSNRT